MTITRFGIIGGGWRAEFFIRVAQALSDRFSVSSVMVRDPAKALAFASRMNVRTCNTMDELLADTSIDYIVLSVSCVAHPQLLAELAERKMPVLCETPPGRDLADMNQVHALLAKGLRIQIAEQLHLRPLHAARIALAQSGILGNVHQAQVSIAHGYHGISLVRRLLGITFEDVTLTARRVPSSIVVSPGREGPPTEDKMEKDMQELAWLDFGDRFATFDFAGSQYFSWVRSVRLLVQGDRGEIHNDELRYLKDFRTPVHCRLMRQNAGENDNLEGFHFKGIQAGDQWIYTNPSIPARLSDDEIAVASCMEKMAEYVQGGPEFYSLAEACQDNYIAQLIQQAATSGEKVTSTRQVWAS